MSAPVVKAADDHLDAEAELKASDLTRIDQALAKAESNAIVDVVICEDMAWRTSFDLPLAARRKLRQVIQCQLEKESPIPPALICFAVGKVQTRGERLTADVLLVKSTEVNTLARAFRAAKLRVGRVYVSESDFVLPVTTPFRPGDWSVWRKLQLAVIGTGAVMMMVSGWIYSFRLDQAIAHMTAAVRAEQADFQENLSTLESNRDRLRLLEELRSSLLAGDPGEILADLTEHLPETVWLVEFHLSGRQVEIEGYAEQPANVAMVVRDLPVMDDASLLWTRSGDDGDTRQRFRVQAMVGSPP